MNTVITDMLNSIGPDLYWLAFKLGIAAIIIIVLKNIFENVASYYMFRWNKYLGNGVRVNINGHEGVIDNYDRSSIYIKIEGGDFLIVPVSRWRLQKWIVKNFDDELKILKNSVN